MPSSLTTSTIVRNAYGACKPDAARSGGSLNAIGVTRTSTIFTMDSPYVRHVSMTKERGGKMTLHLPRSSYHLFILPLPLQEHFLSAWYRFFGTMCGCPRAPHGRPGHEHNVIIGLF
jgi:hypothetical protein